MLTKIIEQEWQSYAIRELLGRAYNIIDMDKP